MRGTCRRAAPASRARGCGEALAFRAMTGVALAEELLLLAYDDETGKATDARIGLDLGMAAAVLVELALAGRIAYADGNLAVIDPAPDRRADRRRGARPDRRGHPAHARRRGCSGCATACATGSSATCAPGAWSGTSTRPSWASSTCTATRWPTPSVEAEIRSRLAEALTSGAAAGRADRRAGHPGRGAADGAGAGADRRGRRGTPAGGWRRSPAAPGFSGTVSLEDSVVRPSVGLVVAALGRAVDAALGKRQA